MCASRHDSRVLHVSPAGKSKRFGRAHTGPHPNAPGSRWRHAGGVCARKCLICECTEVWLPQHRRALSSSICAHVPVLVMHLYVSSFLGSHLLSLLLQAVEMFRPDGGNLAVPRHFGVQRFGLPQHTEWPCLPRACPAAPPATTADAARSVLDSLLR